GVRLHDLLTIFLDPANGKGGIRHVVNGVGGSSTIANPDVPVTVVDYP
ncbi:MAG: secreted protein, partial [Humibacillus sp.]|nr:secreted protein [Humibacillus sp.]